MQKIYIFGLILLLSGCSVPVRSGSSSQRNTNKNYTLTAPLINTQVTPSRSPARSSTSRTTKRR